MPPTPDGKDEKKEEYQPQQLRVLQRGDPENLRFWVAPPRVKKWRARMRKKHR